MKVNLPSKIQNVHVGDVVVFEEKPYFLIRTRKSVGTSSNRYDFVSFTGDSYWTGDLTWEEVKKNIQDRDGVVYPSSEYMLTLEKRSEE